MADIKVITIHFMYYNLIIKIKFISQILSFHEVQLQCNGVQLFQVLSRTESLTTADPH
jgi:hypothetical protein